MNPRPRPTDRFLVTSRVAIGALAVFIAVSAIGGSLGLLGGGIPLPPLSLLAGTPFTGYAIPAAILGLVVGGSTLVAAGLLLMRHPFAVPAAAGAGLVQVGWIVGEVLLLGTAPGLMISLQTVYLAAGGLLFGLAARLWLRSRRGLLQPAPTGASGSRAAG